MASCVRQSMEGTAERKAQDSETWEYLYQGDEIPDTALEIIDLSHSTGPNPTPVVGTRHPDRFIFVQTISARQTPERRDSYKITVNFGPPDAGEDQDHQEQTNPLFRPPVYDIQYIETEYVIKQARNVEEFTGALGRAALTLGPIENAAYTRPDEPQCATDRNAVIVIEKNYPSLGAIMGMNEDFQRTCNSDVCNVGGRNVAARRLRYLVTASLGRQQEGDFVYYPGRTEIELCKTTDLILDNVGYEYIPAATLDVLKAEDKNGEFVSEPVNLKLDGDLSGPYGKGPGTQITWRYLDEVAYAGFFS